MALDVGRMAEGALERVRRLIALPPIPGPRHSESPAETFPQRGQGGGTDGDGDDGREDVMAEQDEREESGAAAAVAMEAEEEDEERDDREGEEEDEGEGEEPERSVRRRRARAVVLDAGRPAAPASWRGLPAVELVRQGIADADRKRRR